MLLYDEMEKKIIKIEKLKKISLSAGCVLAAAGCIAMGVKNHQQAKTIDYQEPKNQIEVNLDENVENETITNSLEDNYIKSYFLIEEFQRNVNGGNCNQNEIEADVKFVLNDLNQNSQKLLSLLEQLVAFDVDEARESGLSKSRMKALQANNLQDITEYEKNILEKIAMKHEACQFLQARNAVRSGKIENDVMPDSQLSNHYLAGIKNNDLRKNAKQITKIVKQNILGLSGGDNTTVKQATEQTGNYYNVYFDDLHLYSRMFILADYFPKSVGDSSVCNCLALEIITQHQLNKYLDDLEKHGYDVDKIVAVAQSQMSGIRMEDDNLNKNLAKKKSKFINQGIKVISQINNLQDMSK